MTLSAITSGSEVRKSLGLIKDVLRSKGRHLRQTVTWPTGKDELLVYWYPRHNFWATFDGDLGNRYKLWFGCDDPADHKRLRLRCEINPPKKGIDRRCGGVFAKDTWGNIYLMHSGKVGGGGKGVGKNAFVEFYAHGRLESVIWPDGRQTDQFLLAPVLDPDLIGSIAKFVHKVDEFKQQVTQGPLRQTISKIKEPQFTPEFIGKRRPYRVSLVQSVQYHGKVVESLVDELRGRGVQELANDRRDLFVFQTGRTGLARAKVLFEIKTDLSPSSIFSAVGQLMVYGAHDPEPPLRVIVLPGEPDKTTKIALARLDIEVLRFSWNKRQPVFLGLDDVVRRFLG